MIKGLRGASIWSEDVKKLLPFYRDLLGHVDEHLGSIRTTIGG